jgi:lipoprotein-anchoring transpeptidase ErfK/SrfK
VTRSFQLRVSPIIAGAVLLAGCHVVSNESSNEKTGKREERPRPRPESPSLTFEDVKARTPPGDMRVLKVQVVLDHLGFSPGVIDGKEGQSLRLALTGFQKANDLPETGEFDKRTQDAMQRWRDVPAVRTVKIPDAFAKGPFVPDFPAEAEDQAKLPALGYRDLTEALAERFHTSPETLAALNPNVRFERGATIVVPNIPDIDPARLGKDERGWNRTLQLLGVSNEQPQAEEVVVDKSEGVLRALDADGKVLAQFPATMGSSHDPLPLGRWKIQGISRNPDFHYNPKLFWDVSNAKEAVMLKPGPNGPVGVVWIDLSKPHYGIHGTSEPQTIGRAESHGCVRLTNWDAARLAQMVKAGAPAVFQE